MESQAPRQSKSIPTSVTLSDGDVWDEKLVVCEAVADDGSPKLVIRSYFRNVRSNERVWDEPPSGAAQINRATPAMRRVANTEKEEMQTTLNMIPSDDDEKGPPAEQKKKKGFFRRFRKREKPTLKDESKDLVLQKALARSIAETSNHNLDDGAPQHRGGTIDADDEIELAKAISASEAQYAQEQRAQSNYQPDDEGLTEEEMFQRALAASRGAQKPSPQPLHSFPKGTESKEAEEEEELLRLALEESEINQYACAPVRSVSVGEESIALMSIRQDSKPKLGVKTDPNERYQEEDVESKSYHPSIREDRGLV